MSGATATLSSSFPYTTVVDGSLEFGAVGAGESAGSETTFSIYHDRRDEINSVVALSGTVTDSDTSQPVSGTIVLAKNTEAELVGTTTTDENGNYSFILDPGIYTLTFKTLGYDMASKSISMEAGGQSYTMDLSMDEVVAWAGEGKTLSGDLAEATDEDIVMENSMMAMSIEDNGLRVPGSYQGRLQKHFS